MVCTKAGLEPVVCIGEVACLRHYRLDPVVHCEAVGQRIRIFKALTNEFVCRPDNLHADKVGDLDVVLSPDAGNVGGEEHGGPGQCDKESAGDEQLEAVVGEHPLQLQPQNHPWIGSDVILPEVPEKAKLEIRRVEDILRSILRSRTPLTSRR